MVSYLSASWVYPVSAAPLKNGVIAVQNDGTIDGVYTAEEALEKNIRITQQYQGYLVPGLINTHCHLELSYLAGKVPLHLGLPKFVQQIIQKRVAFAKNSDEEMRDADAYMYANGIVAVGDISNQASSRKVKIDSKIYYHTFVETMGFVPGRASEIIENAKLTRAAFSPLKATIVPHAPYSVSEELFEKINEESGNETESVSIHNQETAEENIFFQNKSGQFLQFYKFLGLDLSFFEPQGKSSLQTYLPRMSTAPRTLLVHNTFTNSDDLGFASRTHKNLFWCLCPNANLYIENRLPDVNLLKGSGAIITLGTDSLASNYQLSILSEMLTLQEKAGVSFDELLSWATINGAKFLGIEHTFGSFEITKKPGVNLIRNIEGAQLSSYSTIERLI